MTAIVFLDTYYQYESMPRRKKQETTDTDLEDDKGHAVQLGTAGRLVIPQAVRDELGLVDGVKLRVRAKQGRIVITTGAGDLEFAKEQLAKISVDDA